MCLALPSRILCVHGDTAVVESGGERREVSLLLLDEPVAVGDYLVVRNGCFAAERLDPEAAREALALIAEVVDRHGGADVRGW
jgi:hydrogenase expression/formation protein HypC